MITTIYRMDIDFCLLIHDMDFPSALLDRNYPTPLVEIALILISMHFYDWGYFFGCFPVGELVSSNCYHLTEYWLPACNHPLICAPVSDWMNPDSGSTLTFFYE